MTYIGRLKRMQGDDQPLAEGLHPALVTDAGTEARRKLRGVMLREQRASAL